MNFGFEHCVLHRGAHRIHLARPKIKIKIIKILDFCVLVIFDDFEFVVLKTTFWSCPLNSVRRAVQNAMLKAEILL